MTATMLTVIAVIAGVYLLASLLWLVPRKPGYSHIKHTIRELGEISAIALSVLPSASIRGLIQRVAEICLFSGLALAVWQTRR